MLRTLLPALLLAVTAATAGAQVVERPEPFDSAGRVMALTPVLAARLQLAPPAWRITGDFREARLYNMGDGGWVIVVTRRMGEVERYAVTAADRDYLRAKTALLPPGLTEQVQATVRDAVQEARRPLDQPEARTGFILAQTALGLTVYAPSFARAVTNQAAGRAATYLLVAGGTYFAAASLSREMHITTPQNVLATTAAVRGGLAGYGIAYALGAPGDGEALGVFAGSLAGTASGLYFGRRMTSADAMAASFGSDLLVLTTAGALRAAGVLDRDGGNRRAAAAALVGAGIAGFPLGLQYARAADYNVTPGDVATLWVAGGIGTLAAATIVEALDTEGDEALYLGLTGGFLAGVAAGDRLLVRRFDHTWGQAGTVLAGAVAGGLMGAGVARLADGDRTSDALVLSLMTVGAVAGVGASDWLISTPADAGRARRGGMRMRLDPAGLALAAGGVPGRHALVTVTF